MKITPFRSVVHVAPLFGIGVLLTAWLLSGCKTIVSRPADPRTNEATGIVYSLPRSVFRVSIESKKDAKGAHTELAVGTGVELIPDTSNRFVLRSSPNELFSRKHAIYLTNGMLSSVSTEDDGKANEIITDLAAIAFNIISFGALPPTKGLAADISKSRVPDGSEISEALNSIPPGQQIYVLPIINSETNFLAGTGSLLAFSTETKGLPVSGTPNKLPPQPTTKPASFTNFAGILTKVLEPYTVEVELHIELGQLYKNRVEKLTEQVKERTKTTNTLAKEIKELEARIAKNPPNVADLQNELDAKKKKHSDTGKEIDPLQESKAANADLVKAVGDRRVFFSIGKRASVVFIPDFSPIVKIPIKRGPIGKTTYNLTLDHGVLVSQSMDTPSAVLEFVKVPLTITESLVKLPTQLIQLKFDYSSKVKDLLTKQAEIEAAQKVLAGKAPLTEHEQAVELLEQQKQLLALQKEIAELKAEIDKLAKEE